MDKVQDICKKSISKIVELSKFGKHLLEKGDFENFERNLTEQLNELHDNICSVMINETMDNPIFEEKMLALAKSEGISSLSKRKVEVQFKTGNKRTVRSYYAKRRKGQTKIDRHVGLTYLGFIKKASPLYVSISSLISVLCPSFEIGKQLMNEIGINGKYNRIRNLSLELGKLVVNQGVSSIIEKKETMEDKRVVVMIDGGRSRTRLENGELSEQENPTFKRDWREVKVVVIQVLDENGDVERKENLPLYDITVGGIEKAMKKLGETLVLLNVKAARGVQFISDGATCFWNNIEAVFAFAEVPQNKITYTLDYYHAVEHLSALLNLVTVLNEKERKKWFVELKQRLWEGQIQELIKEVKLFCQKKMIKIKDKLLTEINYFQKHKDHMTYQLFRQRKWLCGSGAVESAIRRIINLRFKAPASFWLEEHIEPLAFLRATFLAGRWKILFKNLKY
jgi:hypothetical protein